MAGKKETKKAASISKSALLNAIAEATGEVTRKQVKAVLDNLAKIGQHELKKNGIFTVPGFAKFRVVKESGRFETDTEKFNADHIGAIVTYNFD